MTILDLSSILKLETELWDARRKIETLEAELRSSRQDVMIADEKTARALAELDMANGTIDDLHRKLDIAASAARRDL